MGKPAVAAETSGKRIDRDDPSLSQRNIWNLVKFDFHDSNILIAHPPNWTDACDLDEYADIQPNDENRVKMHMNRDTDFF